MTAVAVAGDTLQVNINVSADSSLKDAVKNQIQAALGQDTGAKFSIVGQVTSVAPGNGPDRVVVTTRVTNLGADTALSRRDSTAIPALPGSA